MTSREKMIHALEALPESATFEDAMERLLVMAKIERGLLQADEGKTISHADMKDRIAKWPS